MIRLDIHRGMNIELGEVPAEVFAHDTPEVALLGGDFPGVRPRLMVEVGTEVCKGETLFVDRARPDIRFTAPVDGKVSAVHGGARRSLESLVLEVADGDFAGGRAATMPVRGTSIEALRETLLLSGLWPAFRTRPYSRIPNPASIARELYVTAMDTNPLAPDPAPYIREHAEPFVKGLEILAGLAQACYVCMQAGSGLPCPDARGLTPVEIAGPHPAGLPGTHIYEIARAEQRQPIGDGIWHVGYQDVIAIGYLFLDGRLFTERLVTIAGPGVSNPRTVTTVLGTELMALTGKVDRGARIVSGPLLAGRAVTPTTGYLSRYHNQVAVVPASPEANSVDGAGMLSLEAFERVWPFRIPVLPLLRALLIEDTETVSALGCSLLADEDLALCSYVCPSRLNYGAALDRTLAEIRRGG